MQEILQQLIEMVKQASPLIWETYYRQVQINAIVDIVWAVLALLAASGLVYAAVLAYRKHVSSRDDYDYSSEWLICTMALPVVGIVLVLFALNGITLAIQYMLNPNYWTIQFMLNTIK